MGLSPWHLVYSYVQVVNTVCKKMLSEYWEKTKHGKPNHVYEFCDGSAAQFKGAPSFADIADSETELGYSRTRFYFERSHAKGPQDAAGANLKNAHLGAWGGWQDVHTTRAWVRPRCAWLVVGSVVRRHVGRCSGVRGRWREWAHHVGGRQLWVSTLEALGKGGLHRARCCEFCWAAEAFHEYS